MIEREGQEWEERGNEPMTRKQQKVLCAACTSLGEQLRWHGIRFSGDDFRHLISAVILGERLVPGVNQGEGPPGLVRMSRSSLELTKSDATRAIRMAFDIGDQPEDQGIVARPVRWSEPITKMRYIAPDEDIF